MTLSGLKKAQEIGGLTDEKDLCGAFYTAVDV